MDHDDSYRFDQARYYAAIALKPEHISDFQRLVKGLRAGSRFQFLVAEYNDANYRHELIAQIDAVLVGEGQSSAQLSLTPESHADFSSVESDLRSLAAVHQAIHVLGGESWFTDERWQAFNIRREAVAQGAPTGLIFWLSTVQISRLALMAPDLWAWRSGVFSFSTVDAPLPIAPVAQRGPVDTRTLAERSKRIAELREYLDAEPPYSDEIRLPLLDELADLYLSIGKPDEALRIRREVELPIYLKLDDEYSVAVIQSRIADIVQSRGEPEEALHIYQEESLPAFERLGEVREAAIIQGRIADILQLSGKLGEALLIRREVELPVYEMLGDIRSVAVTQGKIADILEAQGQLDDALRIRRDVALPVYEKLGDVRSVAVTQGKIADIMQARGNSNEALKIYQEVSLPVFEKLGNVRLVAIIQGKIADILQMRGQFDEALRSRMELELPVFEKLGDMREVAVTQGKIADILQARGELEKALRIRREVELPVYEKLNEAHSVAVTQSKIADILRLRAEHK